MLNSAHLSNDSQESSPGLRFSVNKKPIAPLRTSTTGPESPLRAKSIAQRPAGKSIYTLHGLSKPQGHNGPQKSIDFNSPEDFEHILGIMQKPPGQRGEEEAKFLQKAFKGIRFFNELDEDISPELFLKLFRELKHEFLAKRATVFQAGSFGSKFYIILKGGVQVMLPKEGFQGEEVQETVLGHKYVEGEEFSGLENVISIRELGRGNVEEEEKSQALVFLKRQLKEFDRGYSRKGYSERENGVIAKHVKRLNKLDHGAPDGWFVGGRVRIPEELLGILRDSDYLALMFPEMAKGKELDAGGSFGELALRRDIPRTATIVCREDTHFAVLTKGSFKEILSQHYQKLYTQNFEFLLRFPLFNNWKVEYIEQFFFQLELRVYPKGQLVFGHRNPCSDIYFIKRGDIEISIVVAEKKKKQGKIKENVKKIAILGAGEIFGQEEMFFELENRFTARALSEAHLFKISKEKFLTVVKNDKTIKELKESTRNILKWRYSQSLRELDMPRIGPIKTENKPEELDLHLPPASVLYKSLTTNQSMDLPYKSLNESSAITTIQAEKQSFYTDRGLEKGAKKPYVLSLSSKKPEAQDVMSELKALTHMCREAHENDRKNILLKEIIKKNEEKTPFNLNYLREYFFTPGILPQLPQFKKRLHFSYLQPDKDMSRVKDLMIRKVGEKKEAFRRLVKQGGEEDSYLFLKPKNVKNE